MSFEKQRVHGLEENQRANDVDLEMVLERSDVDFSDILPIVGNSSVRNRDDETTRDLFDLDRCCRCIRR